MALNPIVFTDGGYNLAHESNGKQHLSAWLLAIAGG
jgi:hypothetical protein